MRKILIAFLFVALCGCSIFPKGPDMPVSNFDLGIPPGELNFSGCLLEAGDFQGKMPSRQKMVFRSGGNRLIVDEFNRWADIPPELLKAYLSRAFARKSSDGGSRRLLVEGDLFQFEGNLDRMTADIEVELKVLEPPDKKPILKKIYKESVSFERNEVSQFAAAMSSAASRTAPGPSRC